MEALNTELREEYDKLAERYGFFYREKKIVFLSEFRKRNKLFKFPSYRYLIPRLKYFYYFLSMPFIYGMIIPTLILDISLLIYQGIAFRLYGIPLVRRADYVVFDRRFLDYLNFVQKVNCLYCSYVNGVFAFAVEVGARTERFWCPIKAAHKPKFSHGWYRDFADYGNPEEWQEKYGDESKAFIDAYGDRCFTAK